MNTQETQSPGSVPAGGSASAFDLEQVYDKEVDPLMDQIIAICKRVKMPMIACFCYAKGRNADDPEGLDLCTTALPRDGWQAPELKEAVQIIRTGASTRPKLMAFTIRTPNDKLTNPAAE